MFQPKQQQNKNVTPGVVNISNKALERAPVASMFAGLSVLDALSQQLSSEDVVPDQEAIDNAIKQMASSTMRIASLEVAKEQAQQQNIGKNMSNTNENEMDTSNGALTIDEAARNVEDFMNSIQHNTEYTTMCKYTVQGSLEEFQNNPEKLRCTLQCDGLTQKNHKPVIMKTKVIAVTNTLPFPVGVKLEGTPISTLLITSVPNAFNKASYEIDGNTSNSNMNLTLFNDDATDYAMKPLDIALAGKTKADVEACIALPTEEQMRSFLVEHKLDESLVDETASNLLKKFEAVINNGFQCIKEKSILGSYIKSKINSGKIPPLPDFLPIQGIMVMDKKSTDLHKNELINRIHESPISTIHGNTATFLRIGGQAWTDLPTTIHEAEANHLLKNQQTLSISLRHTVIAVKDDRNKK